MSQNNMQKTTLKILGMKCQSCAKIIKFGLEEEKGVASANVDFGSEKVFLEFDPTETSLPEIENKIKDLGYKTL